MRIGRSDRGDVDLNFPAPLPFFDRVVSNKTDGQQKAKERWEREGGGTTRLARSLDLRGFHI